MKSEKRIYNNIMLIVVVALVTFIITTVTISNTNFIGKFKENDKSVVNTKLSSKLNILNQIFKKDFLGKIDEDKLIDGAIKGYVNGLDDEYAEYFTKEEMEQFKSETEGNYVGIGIYMLKNTSDNNILVLSTIKGSPAENAGIKALDIIKKVDGKEYTAEDFENIAENIKGKEGTNVSLELQRGEEILTINVERKKIEIYPMESKVLENKIGYINIQSFDENCSKKFKENYDKLKKENITSLIIDIRNNGGGIVDEAFDILDYILDKDMTMIITKDNTGKEVVEKAKNRPIINIPIVVLVNENTASSSEIFAVALKENGKAKIIGEKTYGKGVIQELLTLGDGSGIKITTDEYYTPNKNKINKIGIEPDIKVEQDEKEKNAEDVQLKRAIEELK